MAEVKAARAEAAPGPSPTPAPLQQPGPVAATPAPNADKSDQQELKAKKRALKALLQTNLAKSLRLDGVTRYGRQNCTCELRLADDKRIDLGTVPRVFNYSAARTAIIDAVPRAVALLVTGEEAATEWGRFANNVVLAADQEEVGTDDQSVLLGWLTEMTVDCPFGDGAKRVLGMFKNEDGDDEAVAGVTLDLDRLHHQLAAIAHLNRKYVPANERDRELLPWQCFVWERRTGAMLLRVTSLLTWLRRMPDFKSSADAKRLLRGLKFKSSQLIARDPADGGKVAKVRVWKSPPNFSAVIEAAEGKVEVPAVAAIDARGDWLPWGGPLGRLPDAAGTPREIG